MSGHAGAERHENHNGLDEEAGQTKDKADSKRGLPKPARPGGRPADEHQGAQEAQLERQEEQETQLGVVGLDDGR